MTNSGSSAMHEYQQVNLRHVVEGATPHRLVQLMMERVLAKIAIARGHMERQAIAEKGKHIGDAISIINGLQVSLNHKANSELCGNFDALYDYMARRLLEGNLRDDDSMLLEVADLMRQVKEAWDAIGDEVATAQPAAVTA
ncbi:MAG: flagellar export chaperone FliS [Woeseia sp.]|nr:flagellar export chaperone FliS [Woeseia sp.]